MLARNFVGGSSSSGSFQLSERLCAISLRCISAKVVWDFRDKIVKGGHKKLFEWASENRELQMQRRKHNIRSAQSARAREKELYRTCLETCLAPTYRLPSCPMQGGYFRWDRKIRHTWDTRISRCPYIARCKFPSLLHHVCEYMTSAMCAAWSAIEAPNDVVERWYLIHQIRRSSAPYNSYSVLQRENKFRSSLSHSYLISILRINRFNYIMIQFIMIISLIHSDK